MTTTIFIILTFIIIVVYDIIVAVTKKQTITAVFRKWFTTKPIIPFLIGLVFIGHFQSLLVFHNVPLFIILSIIYLLWNIIMLGTNLTLSRKWFNISCKFFFIPMIQGFFVGCMWH